MASTTQSDVEADTKREQSRPDSELIRGADSQEPPQFSVVMPTLNEEEGIAECIERIRTAVAELGATTEIIVSDSSTDRTPEIAREKGAIVVEPDEPGYGYAYRYAFERARGDYVVIGDADTTYDFEELPDLVAEMERTGADMVIGSRLGGEIEPGAMPKLHQHVGNPLLTTFLNVFYGAGVSDAHSGFRVIRREALDELECRTTGMEFASEMIMEAGARGLRIEEVPIVYHEREGDATLDSFRDGWRHVEFMLVNAPSYLFSVPGLVLAMLGIVIMGITFADVPIPGAGVTLGTHSMLAGSLLTLVGYQIASLGVFATVASDPIRKPRDAVTTWIVEHIQLEHGAMAGTVIFTLGAVYATYLIIQWITSGYTELPLVMADTLAFTAIVLGIQTVFGSFFLSTVAEE